jgi:hypothetical protein
MSKENWIVIGLPWPLPRLHRLPKCCDMLQKAEKQGRQGRGPLRRRKRSWKLPDIGAIGTSAFLAEFMHFFESFGLS